MTHEAKKAWEFFQANKTFTLEAFRIVMGFNPKEAKRWLTGAVDCGMVKHLGSNKYESTGTYRNEESEPCRTFTG